MAFTLFPRSISTPAFAYAFLLAIFRARDSRQNRRSVKGNEYARGQEMKAIHHRAFKLKSANKLGIPRGNARRKRGDCAGGKEAQRVDVKLVANKLRDGKWGFAQ